MSEVEFEEVEWLSQVHVTFLTDIKVLHCAVGVSDQKSGFCFVFLTSECWWTAWLQNSIQIIHGLHMWIYTHLYIIHALYIIKGWVYLKSAL